MAEPTCKHGSHGYDIYGVRIMCRGPQPPASTECRDKVLVDGERICLTHSTKWPNDGPCPAIPTERENAAGSFDDWWDAEALTLLMRDVPPTAKQMARKAWNAALRSVAGKPSREEIVRAVEPFMETYASPEQIADAVLALFDAHGAAKCDRHCSLPWYEPKCGWPDDCDVHRAWWKGAAAERARHAESPELQ